jgi:hypothetical protein
MIAVQTGKEFVMNVKVVIIVVFVAVLALLGAPLVLGAIKNAKAGGGQLTPAQAAAEWTPTNLVSTSWGAVVTEPVPAIVGTGTITVDMTVTFNSGGLFSIAPVVTFSPDTPASVQAMAQQMLANSKLGGKWTLNYPKLTLTMADPKGAEQSVDATISGSTITGPNLMKPNAPPLTLTRR